MAKSSTCVVAKPKSSSKPPKPIGRAVPHKKANEAAIHIVDLARTHGMLLVLTDPLGRVFAFHDRDDTAEAMSDEHPSWVSGVFNQTAASIDVAESIVMTYRDHQGIGKS